MSCSCCGGIKINLFWFAGLVLFGCAVFYIVNKSIPQEKQTIEKKSK